MTTKGIGSEYRRKLANVSNVAKGIITSKIVSETLHVPTQEAGRILSRWNQQGWIKRINRGIYIPITVDDLTGESSIEDPWVLADRLFSPGYIGGFSAVKHWDFSEQLFEITTFFTSKKVNDRHPIMSNTRFQLKTISAYKLFGTQSVWRDNTKILVSDPSKTIVDLLDDPVMVGGMRIIKDIFYEYHESKFFDFELLIDYTARMNNKTIFKRLGFLMENMGFYPSIEKYNLSSKFSNGYSLFDPSVKNASIVRKWGLKIPTIWKKND